MKYLPLILLILPLLFSCNEEENDLQLDHTGAWRINALYACGSDLNINHDESAEAWSNKVLQIVADAGIPVTHSEIGFDEQLLEQIGWCGNCRPSGDYLIVYVAPQQAEALQALGYFFEL